MKELFLLYIISEDPVELVQLCLNILRFQTTLKIIVRFSSLELAFTNDFDTSLQFFDLCFWTLKYRIIQRFLITFQERIVLRNYTSKFRGCVNFGGKN